MSRVADKVVLVTGAGSGIGRATAKLLAAEGATVIVSDINKPGGLETVQQIGGKARFEEHDTAQEIDWKRIIDGIMAREGRLDGLVNNAGIAGPFPSTFETETVEQWRRMLSINVEGVFLGCKIQRAGDPPVGRRLDRQHLLARGLSRHAGSVGLWREQGGGAAVHQDGGDGLRAQGLQDPLQLGPSRHHHDADGRGHPARRQGARARAQGPSRSANSARRRISPTASST